MSRTRNSKQAKYRLRKEVKERVDVMRLFKDYQVSLDEAEHVWSRRQKEQRLFHQQHDDLFKSKASIEQSSGSNSNHDKQLIKVSSKKKPKKVRFSSTKVKPQTKKLKKIIESLNEMPQQEIIYNRDRVVINSALSYFLWTYERMDRLASIANRQFGELSSRKMHWFIMSFCQNSSNPKLQNFYNQYEILRDEYGRLDFSSCHREISDTKTKKPKYKIILPNKARSEIVIASCRLNWLKFIFQSGALDYMDEHRDSVFIEYHKSLEKSANKKAKNKSKSK